MEQIGIIICNYNKRDFVIECVKHVFHSSYQKIDIIVVDNASNDNSVLALKEEFGDSINLIVNSENLGGSGGFNTGINFALQKDYKYIMLLDNDAFVRKDTIEKMYYFLENNIEVGMLGSKIYSMDNENQIQEFGAEIDFVHYNMNQMYVGEIDCEELPEIVWCDYVPACAMMLRTEAIRNVGIMDEDFFVYWDDIEWGYRFKLAGYKVAALGNATVVHKMGAALRTNTAGTYYFWRNRIRFFLRYIEKNKIENFQRYIKEELFQAIYSCQYEHKENTIKSLLFAYQDAIQGIGGVAKEGRIYKLDKAEDKLKNLLSNKEKILVLFNGDYKTLWNVIKKIEQYNLNLNLSIFSNDISLLIKQFDDYNLVNTYNVQDYDKVIQMVEHVVKIENNSKNVIYIDKYWHIVSNESEKLYWNKFKEEKEYFLKKEISEWRLEKMK